MTHWAMALLVVYVVLACSRVGWRKAGRLATLLTVVAMVYAFHSYGAL